MRAYARIVGGLVIIAVMLGSLPSSAAWAAAQPPIGYERWTNPNAEAGVDFGLTATQVFQKYAASFAFGGIPQKHPRKDKRLIDIEVRRDGSGLANSVYDVAWVKDEGAFSLESWFVPGRTEAEVKDLQQLASHGIVMVDIERYLDNNTWRFSAILQRNTGKFGWQALTNVSHEQVQQTASRNGLRLLDLDYVAVGPLSCQPNPVPGQACNPATFDALLVANSGSNAVETDLHFNMTAAQIAQKHAQGYQVMDHEGSAAVPYMATVWVKPGLPFTIFPSLTENDVIFHHNRHGRVIDLERPPGTTPAPYSIIILP
jgi:hypothetical protein